MGSTANDQFRIHAIIFCLIIILTLYVGHAVGLMIKTDMETRQDIYNIQNSAISEQMKDQMINNVMNMSKLDLFGVIEGAGNVLLGLDLPIELALIYDAFAYILIGYMAYAFYCILRSNVPLVSG